MAEKKLGVKLATVVLILCTVVWGYIQNKDSIHGFLGLKKSTQPSTQSIGPISGSNNKVVQVGGDLIEGVPHKVHAKIVELLFKKDIQLEEINKLLEETLRKYNDVKEALRSGGELEQRAAELLKQGEFEKSGEIIDQLLEAGVKRTASLNFGRGRIFDLQFDWDSALPHYEKAHNLQPDNLLYAIALANILNRQNNFTKAEPLYLTILEQTRKLAKVDPLAYRSKMGVVLTSLGILYGKTQRLEEAERAFSEALGLYLKLAKINSVAYRPGAAMVLYNFGFLYGKTQRLEEAEGAFSEALELYRKLAETNPTYRSDVAMARHQLGLLYSKTQRLEEAEGAFSEALGLYRELAKINPVAYRSKMAMVLNYFGLLYSKTQRPEEAEVAFSEALGLYRELVKANPAYRSAVANTLNSLGMLYRDLGLFRDTNKLKEAENAHLEALELYKKLAEVNPAAYLPSVASKLFDLGFLYSITDKFKEGEEAFLEALKLFRKLAEVNPAEYFPSVVSTLGSLGNSYHSTNKPKEAEEALLEALELCRKFAEANPATYQKHAEILEGNLEQLRKGLND